MRANAEGYRYGASEGIMARYRYSKLTKSSVLGKDSSRFMGSAVFVVCTAPLGVRSPQYHSFLVTHQSRYNSIVFVSTTNHLYDVYVANEQFQQGAWFDPGIFNDANFTAFRSSLGPNFVDPAIIQTTLLRNTSESDATRFDVLSPTECIKAYSKQILSDHRNVVLVTTTMPRDNQEIIKPLEIESMNTSIRSFPSWDCSTMAGYYTSSADFNSITCISNSSLYAMFSYNMLPLAPVVKPMYPNWFNWVCSQLRFYYDYIPDQGRRIEVPQILQPPPRGSLCSDGFWKEIVKEESWSVYGFKIAYCLSERPRIQCSLQVSGQLWLVVIVFNAIKVICIILTIIVVCQEEPLLTIGDAIASFISIKDNLTKGACMLSRRETKNRKVPTRSTKQHSRVFRWRRRTVIDPAGSKIFHSIPLRWCQSVSRTRWAIVSFS
jgi:hypothetical protein